MEQIMLYRIPPIVRKPPAQCRSLTQKTPVPLVMQRVRSQVVSLPHPQRKHLRHLLRRHYQLRTMLRQSPVRTLPYRSCPCHKSTPMTRQNLLPTFHPHTRRPPPPMHILLSTRTASLQRWRRRSPHKQLEILCGRRERCLWIGSDECAERR